MSHTALFICKREVTHFPWAVFQRIKNLASAKHPFEMNYWDKHNCTRAKGTFRDDKFHCSAFSALKNQIVTLKYLKGCFFLKLYSLTVQTIHLHGNKLERGEMKKVRSTMKVVLDEFLQYKREHFSFALFSLHETKIKSLTEPSFYGQL